MISKANVKNIYPLTPLQEGILFHSLYDAGSSYFEQFCYRVRGRLDFQLFQKAWEELVRRHDVLRTIFVHKDVPRPLQIVLKQWRIDFTTIDLCPVTPEEAEARIALLKEQDRSTSFDLAKDPLTRVAVILLADEEAEIIWSHHHIILDGWSAGIVQAELLEIYSSLVQGRKHLLPEPFPFSGYVTWIGKQDQEQSRRFWHEYLDGFSQATGIPRLLSDKPAASGRGNLHFRLDRQRSTKLAALAAGNDVTLNVLLQTLWGILLCRCNGVDQAVFAATVSGRPDDLKGIEGMVGLFINAVPVRVPFSGCATFPELLSVMQAETLAASRHHWYSLADIQAETQLKQALLDHILIFENFPLDERLADADQADGRDFAIVGAEIRENTNYPFELSIIPGKEIEFKMGYDRAVYADEQIQRVGWWLEQLIDHVLEVPDARLAALSILSPREKALILTRFNRPPGAEAAETVADALERQVATTPDVTALVFGSLRWSYRELNSAANRVANLLQQQFRVEPDQVIGILMDRSERMMAALLGVIKSGAAYLPLDPAFPAARIAYMLEDSGCKILLTESRQGDYLSGIATDAVMVQLDRIPDAPDVNPQRITRPDHLLYLIYTSGSTGLPKGVMLEQRNVISFNRNMKEVYGLCPGDTILALTTITFDISVLELICSLMSGMTIVLASDSVANNPGRAAALLSSNSVNVLQITPSRLKLMLEETEVPALFGLKALLVGGEPLPEYLFERLKGLPETRLFNVYGPTEATIWSTTALLDNAALTIGRPLVDEDVLMLSATGDIMPIGVWGEICIGGQGLARGYWNRPELTLDRFISHPVRPGERIYRTGDLGRFLPGGEIQCGGRMDNQVKVRGYRIETGEIEQTLLKIPGVREAVAHVVEIDGLNEIVAYIVPEEESAPSPSGMRADLSQSLPDYMLPTYYVTLEKVPLTPNGKTDRKALPFPTGGRGEAGQGDTGSYCPPRTDTEAGLAAIWQRILGVERVGINDNFFDLGGHSIKAIRIASAIAKELGVEAPLPLIFRNPVLASLAAALQGNKAADETILPLPPQEWYQTSPGQRRLWVLQQMAPASPAYNMPAALKMQGDLDLAALEKSICSLVERHEALRTIFPQQDGLPVQVIMPPAREYVTTFDLRKTADPWQQALLAAQRQASIPFRLSEGPLFKVLFYRTAEDEGLLLVLMHHINGDGWSWGIILRELSEQYHLHANGRSCLVSQPPVQYKEWAHYQNQALSTQAWESMRQYWHNALSGFNAPLNLPTDFHRPGMRRDGGNSLTLVLPAKIVSLLDELARSHGATLFMILLALLKTLLYRMSGQEEITVGIPVAGRPMQQLEGVVGFFVNTLALADRIAPDDTFIQLLGQVRQTALGAYQHQLYPFDMLVNELAIPRDTGHAPLFDVMAVFQEKTERIPAFGNLVVSPVSLPTGTSRFDLTFNFSREDDQGMTLELEYATDLFLPETAERIAQRFLLLAESAVSAPETALKELELLPERERACLRASESGSVHPWPEQKSMVDLFRDRTARYPDAVAVVASDASMTYAELDRLSDNLALNLQTRHNLKPEQAVAVMTGRSSFLPVALLGIMKGGGVYLPVDPDQPESRIRHILEDSGTGIILTDGESAERVACYNDMAKILPVSELLDISGDKEPLNPPGPLSGAYIIYTSGSTGMPKGVLLQHGGFVNMILDQIRTFGVTPQDRCLLFSTFSFDGAMSEIFLALHSGATLVIARREQITDPAAFSRLLEETGATVATLPPVYLNALAACGLSLDPLRVIITAGEAAIAADTIFFARKKTVFNAYGPTEASVCAAIHKVDPSRPYYGSIPIGAPMANSELLLLNERLQTVPFGVSGEICLSGPGLARGYLNNPLMTAEKFVPHPGKPGERLYRTGDLGRRMADGTLQFLGRRDNQVKVRGYRIECGEVERALLNHPAIGGAVVLALGDGPDRELVAFLLKKGELDPGSLKTGLAGQLPAFMLPSRFVMLDAFPLNSNGKVDRKQLAADGSGREPVESSGEPPATVMERRLATIWEQVLGHGNISRHDSFFEIGGQSIAAIKLAAGIRQQMELSLPLPVMFSYPVLRDMALQCERSSAYGSNFDAEACLQITGNGTSNIFAFPPITGYSVAYGALAQQFPAFNLYGFNFLEHEERLERYREEINRIQPEGDLILLGYSSGGNLAFEMAKQLEQSGRRISRLILLDCWKRLPDALCSGRMDDWIDDYHPDPALYGELAGLMESPHIREIAFGKMRSYLSYTESIATSGVIAAPIHLLKAEDEAGIQGLSQEWHEHTTGGFSVHKGSGNHLAMLHKPWADTNGVAVNDILSGILHG